MATPAFSTMSEIVVLLVPLVVKSSKAVLYKASSFFFLFDSNLPIKKTSLYLMVSPFIINRNDQKSISQKEVVDFWTHWQKRILTNGQFGYITLDE